MLLEFCDLDQIPKFLGGENPYSVLDDVGPWNEYDIVDSATPGDEVGVRRKVEPTE